MHKKEIVEKVTFIDTPPLVCVGLVGYIETPTGLQSYRTVWAEHLGDEVKRRLYKKMHSKYSKLGEVLQKKYTYQTKDINGTIEKINQHCVVVRAICHTQIRKVPLGQRRAHLMEVQVNGGTTQQKTEFVKQYLEKEIPIDLVFKKDEVIDIIGVTKGKGFQGVTKRWGTKKLPRKTHKGLRKVGCIGAWHPSRVLYSVARAGQMGFHHRTEYARKIYKLGKESELETSGQTEFDITAKSINPMGGFPNYGYIKNDFIMVKGSTVGPRKRILVLRKAVILCKKRTRKESENVELKFIDTSSKIGHGRFQTSEEKRQFYGTSKKERLRNLQQQQ